MGKAERITRLRGETIEDSIGVGRPAGVAKIHVPAAPPGGFGDAASREGTKRIATALAIEVDRIEADPDQPRKEFDPDDLADLAASLEAHGQLQPIRVRWSKERARWVVIAGERRWRAARLAGLPTLSAIVHDGEIPGGDPLEMQIVENVIRSDLRPIERAEAFRRLMAAKGWNQKQLAESLKVSRTVVHRSLSLLRLPAEVRDLVEAGELSERAASEITQIEDPEEQVGIARIAVSHGLSREAVERAIKDRLAPPPPPPADSPGESPRPPAVDTPRWPDDPPPADSPGESPRPGHEVAPGVRIVPVAKPPDSPGESRPGPDPDVGAVRLSSGRKLVDLFADRRTYRIGSLGATVTVAFDAGAEYGSFGAALEEALRQEDGGTWSREGRP